MIPISDTVYVTGHPDGVTLSPNGPVFELHLDTARNIVKKAEQFCRNWLKEKMDLD